MPTVDGEVLEWPQALAIRPAIANALLERARADHTYFVAWDEKYLYLAGDIADSHLEPAQPGLPWHEGDYLSIHLGPVSSADTGTDYTTAIFISPSGGGADGQQPYVTRWLAAQGYRQITLRVKKRLRSGGFTIEARIPVNAIASFQTIHGAAWKIKLTYQNVNEIYQTQWEGIVTLRP